MININVATELMTDFATDAYEVLRGKYPAFLIDEWQDKVLMARVFREGYAEEEDQDIMIQWANEEGLDLIAWSDSMIIESREFTKMKQVLSGLYRQSLFNAGVAAATAPETLPGVFATIIANTQATMAVLAGDDEQVKQTLFDLLAEMQDELTEALNGS